MTTAATSLLGLALPVTGELSGTWGSVVNDSITSLLDNAIAGTTTLSTDADVTLTTTTLAANQSRQAIILWTASGTATRYITAPAQSKIYTVINKTGSTQSIVIRGVGPTTGVTVPAGRALQVAWNGVDFVDVSDSFAANGTANGVVYLNASKVPTAGSALVFDGTSLGVGVTPSAWSGVGSALQIGVSAAIIGNSASSSSFISNAYYDGSAYRHIGAGYAARLALTSGAYSFQTSTTSGSAGGVVTFTAGMTLDASGNLGIGTTSPGSRLEISASNPVFTIYNTNTGDNGITWESDAAAGASRASLFLNYANAELRMTAGAAGGSYFQSFYTNGSERMRLDSSGNLGLGVTPSASSACVNMEFGSYGATLSARNTSSAPQFAISSNAVGNWYAPTYKINGKATQYTQQGFDGTHAWYVAGTGTAGNAISFTQAMTLDASGKLLLGGSSSDLSGTAQAMIMGSGGLAVQYTGTTGTYLNIVPGAANGTVDLKFDARSGGYPAATFWTGAAERARIDSSGNLGIGTTSQNERLRVNSSTAGQARLTVAYADSVISYFGSYSGIVGSGNATDVMLSSANVLAFGSGGTTERARIDSSGRLLVGQTSYSTTTDGVALQASGSVFARSGTGAATNINIANGNGVVGTITTSGTSTAYNTSSDYRLKESIAPMTGALAKVAALKPVTYKWKSDGSDGEGFIAHELAEVVPQCVTGEKDAVDAEGNPQYQGIDTSFLVATLTAALQEAVAEINSLKARLDAANL